MTAKAIRSGKVIQIQPNPQAPIYLMERPVYRPSSNVKFAALFLLSLGLWALILFVIMKVFL